MRQTNKANYHGYSILEIIIIVSVIGIMAILASTSLKTVSSRARDTQRLNDIRALQHALKIYHTEHSDYPETQLFQPGHSLSINNQRLVRFPNNPWGSDGNCEPGFEYTYTRIDNSSYTIRYCLGAFDNESGSGPGTCHATAQSLCQ